MNPWNELKCRKRNNLLMSLPEKLLVSGSEDWMQQRQWRPNRIESVVDKTIILVFYWFVDCTLSFFNLWEFTDSIDTDWKSFYEYSSIVEFYSKHFQIDIFNSASQKVAEARRYSIPRKFTRMIVHQVMLTRLANKLVCLPVTWWSVRKKIWESRTPHALSA